MTIHRTITELIGNTPLLEISSLSKETGTRIIGKLEYFNPLSSVKDRIAAAMIDAAEESGELQPGGLIIEPTSGNTGVGLAFVAAARNYRLVLTMPDTMSVERRRIVQTLGAELVLTPGEKGMKGAVEEAMRLHAEDKNSFMPQQFQNRANPRIHFETTAPEIWRDTSGTLDYFVAGIGTGGTITGCGQFFREKKPGIQIVAVEPQESAVLSGEPSGPHKIQGIGAGFVPDILDTEVYDRIVRVSSREAADMTRKVARNEGLLVGISSGAALVAARRIGLEQKAHGKTIVVLLPDSGERYLSTWIFEEE